MSEQQTVTAGAEPTLEQAGAAKPKPNGSIPPRTAVRPPSVERARELGLQLDGKLLRDIDADAVFAGPLESAIEC